MFCISGNASEITMSTSFIQPYSEFMVIVYLPKLNAPDQLIQVGTPSWASSDPEPSCGA